MGYGVGEPDGAAGPALGKESTVDADADADADAETKTETEADGIGSAPAVPSGIAPGVPVGSAPVARRSAVLSGKVVAARPVIVTVVRSDHA
jgi:hypothetical protein